MDVNIFSLENSVFSLLHHLIENILGIIPSCKSNGVWYYIDTRDFKQVFKPILKEEGSKDGLSKTSENIMFK